MSDPSDVTDVTQPTEGGNKARFAADEIRQIKAYIQNLVLGILPNVPNPVRQTVSRASINPLTGQPNYLVAGAGLAVSILATAVSVILNSANGFSVNGSVDTNSVISVDNLAAWTVPASNTSYLSYDILTSTTGTFTQSIAPYQESTIYNQGAQSVLQCGGATGSTVFLDDFGNTWAAQGGAKTQVNHFDSGVGGLGGSGALNILNGTTDGVRSTSFTSLGPLGWTLRTKAYITSLAAVNMLIDATNAGAFGAQLFVTAAGKLSYNLSSTGAANDIAAAPVAGAATLVINTLYNVELTYDALAGVYRSYIGGVQDQSTASALRICAITHINWGKLDSNVTGTVGYLDKFEYLPYCQHPAGTVFVPPVATAPNVATQGYASDWFSIVEMKMYQVSGPSAVVGQPPTFTRVPRVYIGEADSGPAAITAVRNRPLNGIWESLYTNPIPALASLITYNHNMGTVPRKFEVEYKCMTADAANAYIPGDVILGPSAVDNNRTPQLPVSTANIALLRINSLGIVIENKTTGAAAALTLANWSVRARYARGWGGA